MAGIEFEQDDQEVVVPVDALVGESGTGVLSAFSRGILRSDGIIVSLFDTGVWFSGTDNTIENSESGVIRGHNGGVLMAGTGGLIINHGDIRGTASHSAGISVSADCRIENFGLIEGGMAGVMVASKDSSLDNTGAIQSATNGLLVTFNATLKATNAAGASIQGGEAAVLADNGARVILSNRGLVDGDILCTSVAADRIVNKGTILGDVRLGDGNDVFNGKGGVSGRVYGEEGDDRLTGGSGNDWLHGGEGDDVLSGGRGKNVLFGGPGSDQFLFDTKVNSSFSNIRDFSAGEDSILLSRSVFKAIPETGRLKKKYFEEGKKAADKNDHVLYDKKSGKLWYDKDGSGSAHKVLFARVEKGTDLSAKDFVVIA